MDPAPTHRPRSHASAHHGAPPLPNSVSSNPSPRYVGVVARAFKQGAYGGTTYGAHYGDFGATFAAILLDREARSVTLDMDPIHGQLREPLLKV